MPSIEEWDQVAHGIDAIYREDLLRSAGQITIGEMANWLSHWREGGHDLDWIRDRIRESDEYRQKHPGGPTVIPLPPPVPPSGPTGSLQRLIKVTDDRDGELINRQYSYWSAACVRGNSIYCFAGVRGMAPQFFKVPMAGGEVERLGARLPFTGEAEGWYWDQDGWIYLIDGPRLQRCNPFSGDIRTVFDIVDSHPGCDLWQAHSSDLGETHSATVRRIMSSGAFPYIGTIAMRRGKEFYDPAQGDLDESQIDATGQWLLIKEKVDGDERNRIIDLDSRITQTISDADGAVGHSDCGPGYVVGEDNIHGACVKWDFRALVPSRRLELFKTWNLGHLSVKGGRCLLSDDTKLALVALDGSGLTHLLDHGMIGTDYDHQVMGNLSPDGRVACYMSNAAGRMDLYLALL